jgi:hypothetical protein
VDFIFDNLIFAVFLVAAVAIQIIRLAARNTNRRRRAGQPEEQAREAAPGPFAPDYDEEYERGAEEDGGAFSAWDLPVSDEPEFPVPAPGPAPAPLLFPVPVPAAGAAYGPEAALPAPPPRPRKAAEGAGKFPGSLNYLPPLKRAVVLAEILGAPKGL